MKIKLIQILKKIKYGAIRYRYKILGYRIGKGFVVGRNVYIEKKGFSGGKYIYIGPFSYIGSNTIIGNYCMLSDHVHIIGHDHQFECVGTPIIFSGRPENQAITILEDDVWIGHSVTIIRGVTIGEGSIVGAGSVVTKNIQPYSIYAGNPARFIRQRFSSDDERLAHSRSLQKNW